MSAFSSSRSPSSTKDTQHSGWCILTTQQAQVIESGHRSIDEKNISFLFQKSALENTLSETQSRYSCQLQDIQRIISHYEEELMQLRHDLECLSNEYKVLLGIKTHLEKEISTYRQLLDGENGG